MSIQYKNLPREHHINWLYRSMAVLLHPKPKFRFNLSKTAVVLIAMSLTAVTMTSNVAAAAENTTPVAAQSGSNAAPGQPNGASTPEQTPPVDYFTNTAEVEAKVLAKLIQAEESSITISNFLNFAAGQIGKPYVFGRTGPKSFDCSGLVYYCLNQTGLSVDCTTASGFSKDKDWEKIASMDDLKPGDIMFFSTGGKNVGHTGIYIGDGEMIDASSSNGEVVQRSCITSYWENHFVFARRPFSVL